MKKTLLFAFLISSLSAHANGFGPSSVDVNPSAPCDPSPFGTYCELQVKVKPTPKFKNYVYCGRTYVAVTPRQRAIIDAYLKEQRTVVVQFVNDGEFINGPCF